MDKDLFVKTIKELLALKEKEENLYKTLNSVGISFDFNISSIELTLNLIERILIPEVMPEWLSYFFFECDGDLSKAAVFHNDELIKLKTWEDVYDFLLNWMSDASSH